MPIDRKSILAKLGLGPASVPEVEMLEAFEKTLEEMDRNAARRIAQAEEIMHKQAAQAMGAVGSLLPSLPPGKMIPVERSVPSDHYLELIEKLEAVVGRLAAIEGRLTGIEEELQEHRRLFFGQSDGPAQETEE